MSKTTDPLPAMQQLARDAAAALGCRELLNRPFFDNYRTDRFAYRKLLDVLALAVKGRLAELDAVAIKDVTNG